MRLRARLRLARASCTSPTPGAAADDLTHCTRSVTCPVKSTSGRKRATSIRRRNVPLCTGPVRSPDRAFAGKDAAQHLHDEPERRALVAARGQEPRARRAVEDLRSVTGRPAGSIAQPVRQRLLAVPLHAHLPLGDDARGHVDRDRDPPPGPGDRDRERVGGQPPIQAAVAAPPSAPSARWSRRARRSPARPPAPRSPPDGRCGSSAGSRPPRARAAPPCRAPPRPRAAPTTCPRPRSPSRIAVVGVSSGRASPAAGASRPSGSSRRTAAPG